MKIKWPWLKEATRKKAQHAGLRNRVAEMKMARAARGLIHKDNPSLSVIIHSFNHRENIVPMIRSLERIPTIEELIISEDGSLDGSLEEWLRHLEKPNHFLIRSNDIHEMRSYDRAIGLARAPIFCLLQDDDVFCGTPWVEPVLALFAKYPKLAIVGGNLASGRISPHFPDGLYGKDITSRDPEIDIPFRFVESAAFGPFFMRKDVYRELGGFDYSMSQPGHNCINTDSEICYRAWDRGYAVGLAHIPFDRSSIKGGSHIFSKDSRDIDATIRTRKIISDKYDSSFKDIHDKVCRANERLVPIAEAQLL
ncbi:MAG: glycosyltransferase [Candidatus Omnitrophota bacterium]|nr:glycosyltransferase [Candidatus Omnitrophota bacterium]